MKRRTNKNEPNKQQAAALKNKIKAVILDGSSFRRRVAQNLAMPAIYSRDDGIYYNPEWQDDFIGRSVSKERVAEILLMLKQRRLDQSPNSVLRPPWPA